MSFKSPSDRSLLALLWVFALPLGATISAAAAERESLVQVALAESVNQTAADVIDAQHNLERWKLDQLELLRSCGYASWLDVAQQQQLVNSLRRRRVAIRSFVAFLQRVHRRIRGAAPAEIGIHATRRIGSPRPIMVSLPGSVRLAGWLESDDSAKQVTHDLANRQRALELTESDLDQRLAHAMQNLTRAEQRCQQIAQCAETSTAASGLRRAELELKLAEAEWRLARTTHHLQRAALERSPFAESRDAMLSIANDPTPNQLAHWFSADASPQLLEATLRIATAEAEADGKLNAAQFDVRRQKLRYQAMRQLRAEGHAGQTEVDVAGQRVAEAERQVQSIQRLRSSLRHSCANITALTDGCDSARRTEPDEVQLLVSDTDPISLPDVQTWPVSILQNPPVVRRLIDLRRQYYETVAQRDALELSLRMRQFHYAKLEKAAAALSARKSSHPAQSDRDEGFPGVLTAGSQRELELLGLDIGYDKSRLRAAEQQMRILALEEARFARQCLQQQDMLHQAAVDSALATDDALVRTGAGLALQPAVFGAARRLACVESISYLESRDPPLLGLVCELAFSKTDFEIVRFAYYPRAVRPLFRTASTLADERPRIGTDPTSSLVRREPFRWTHFGYGASSSIYRRLEACLRYESSGRLHFNRLRLRTPGFTEASQFGIRSSDYPARRRSLPATSLW